MKRRYLMVKRYGLPAIILLFLLIWLGQQNADNSIMREVLVEHQSIAYDPGEKVTKDNQPLQRWGMNQKNSPKNHPSFNLQYRVSSANASTGNTPVDSEILLGIGERHGSKTRDLADNTDQSEKLLGRKERSKNFSAVGFRNEGARRLTKTDVDNERNMDLNVHVGNLSNRNVGDKQQHRVKPATTVNKTTGLLNGVNSVNGPGHAAADFRQTQQPVRRIFGENSGTKRGSVRRTDGGEPSLKLNPLKMPTTASQPVGDFDNDAGDSLILARQLALKNFIKSDESNRAKYHSADDRVRSNVADGRSTKSNVRRRDEREHFFANVASNSSVGRGRRREIDELRRFAEFRTLPADDLPMLKRKTAGDGIVSPSSVRSPLVDSRIGTGGFPVSNVTVGEAAVGQAKSDEDDALADTDDVMSGAVVLGEVSADRMYTVFSTTTENRDALNFVFLLPLTALAWKRVGFDSIVVIVGPVDLWNSDELFHFVLSAVRQLEAVVVFLEPRPEKSVMISQVSRIFIANILRARAAVASRQRPDLIDDTYVVTSDADIWPIYGDLYRLPAGRDVLSLNSDCCGAFSHRNVAYRMLPMANVGMRVRTWRRLTRRFGESPRTVDDILTAVVREFGPVALRPVHKGANVGWFLDQMMVSLLVAEWSKRHGADSVKLTPRDVGVDRLDRNAWGPGDAAGIADKVDAHLPGSAYLPGVWAQIVPLVTQLYGFETDRFYWCMDYYDSFQKLFVAKYRSQDGVGDH